MASLPFVVYGCVAAPVRVDTDTPRGHVIVKPGRAGHVVAAPHASSESRTGDIAAEIARRTGFGLVVATESDPAFERGVRDVAQGALAFYVEIGGTGRRESAGGIEVATVGVDHGLALRLRTLLELIRDAHLRAHPGTPRLPILVAPADPIVYAATAARRDGILRLATRGLHVELPALARGEAREPYTAILAQFVAEVATLRAGR